MKTLLKKSLKLAVFAIYLCAVIGFYCPKVYAMPFYGLNPKPLVERAVFATNYQNSSKERKHNIQLGAKALNNVFVDVGAEFSFNKTVGKRTEKRGYKTAKIIVGGEFVDGVGGGICQVSTTLYNAVLLAGLKIIEYHPHSLQVSYVAPSFDAMVSDNFADLRFINNTDNPIIINAFASEEQIKITITGEKSIYTYVRKSVDCGEILPEDYLEVLDEAGEYPDLLEGESKIIKYAKAGLKSQGLIIKYKDGKRVSTTILRKDTYKAIRGVKIIGTKKAEQNEGENTQENENINLIFNKYKKPFDNQGILW